MMKKITKFIVISLVFYVILVIAHFKPIQIVIVSGRSMEPTLHNNQTIFLYKKDLQRNDVAIFEAPKSWNIKQKTLIKRVIALPLDNVEITKKDIKVNGETIIHFEGEIEVDTPIKFCLCNNDVFVLGDNIGHSIDSLDMLLSGNKEFTIQFDNIKYSANIKRK